MISDYEAIRCDCFWDLNISGSEIETILTGSDFRRKKFLFEKILLNSMNLLQDLSLFPRDELALLLQQFKIPRFNSDCAFRRKNIAEVYFFDKPLQVEELKWNV